MTRSRIRRPTKNFWGGRIVMRRASGNRSFIDPVKAGIEDFSKAPNKFDIGSANVGRTNRSGEREYTDYS